ncbi:MAG: hypothetical protein LBC55_01940 [Desulfovibrio sp.]|jgi:hypothetical protein|nr:hypothetical protein [Desulfovibrio sp.]
MNNKNLPDDPKLLKEIIAQNELDIADLRAEISELQEQLLKCKAILLARKRKSPNQIQ